MHVTARDHPPEVIHRQRQGRLGGDVRVDGILDANLHMRGIDVAMEILFGGNQAHAGVVVGYHIGKTIAMSIVTQAAVLNGTVHPSQWNGVEFIVDDVTADFRFEFRYPGICLGIVMNTDGIGFEWN